MSMDIMYSSYTLILTLCTVTRHTQDARVYADALCIIKHATVLDHSSVYIPGTQYIMLCYAMLFTDDPTHIPTLIFHYYSNL